jgi:hypothetical protein
MKAIALFTTLFGCGQLDEAACIASKDRVRSIIDQREVLLELNNMGRIGNKKFQAIDGMLAEELELEIQRYSRCT